MIWARRVTIAATAAASVLAAGCGSSAPSGRPNAATTTPALPIPLNTSLTTATGSWATIVMGGSAAQRNDFWQVFEQPPGGDRWALVTPPGTADNGGLVLVPGAKESAFAAFRPSNLLTFTPLSRTTDGGQSWSAVSPLDGALAASPGALAVQPGTSRLLALTLHGAVEQESASGSWRAITTERAVAATAAGRRCGLKSLTAAAYSSSGGLLLAGSCSRPGVAGLFAGGTGPWRDASLPLPASLGDESITVLRLVVIDRDMVALLQAGSGSTAGLVAAWSVSGAEWSWSQPFPLRGAALASASFGPSGSLAVTTTAGSAAQINDAGTWHELPRIPVGTTALASLAANEIDALAVDRSTLTVWKMTQAVDRWVRLQSMTVPIQYGSSG